jgi:hypothetical protein
VPRVRTVLIWLIVAFLVYAVFRTPEQAASIVSNAFGGLADGVTSVATFFDALLT